MGLWDNVKQKGQQVKQLYQLQKQAKQIQKKLQDLLVEASALDGKVQVVFNGEQKLEEIIIDDSLMSLERKKELEKGLKDAITQALKKAQQIAAEEMKAVVGDMGLPGL